jgi:hypothetical protein
VVEYANKRAGEAKPSKGKEDALASGAKRSPEGGVNEQRRRPTAQRYGFGEVRVDAARPRAIERGDTRGVAG